ncbi:MAG TPA: alpha/beta hydrolase [Roseiflexaceae bacterium]
MPATSIGDVILAYDIHGQGDPLLLIHGALVSRTYWQAEAAYFAQRYQVITVDLRGHGESSRTTLPYSVELFTRDVVGLLDALGLERVFCCGHSLGGMVAQELAISYPERVRGLILADTWHNPHGLPWEPFPFRTVALKWMLGALTVEGVAALMAQGLSTFNSAIDPYIRREVGRHTRDRANYLKIWDAAIDFDSTARLREIRAPTLIMMAEYFPYTFAQALEMQRRISGAALTTVPHAGHWLNWDNPAGFNQALGQFLDEIR